MVEYCANHLCHLHEAGSRIGYKGGFSTYGAKRSSKKMLRTTAGSKRGGCARRTGCRSVFRSACCAQAASKGVINRSAVTRILRFTTHLGNGLTREPTGLLI